MNEIISPPLVNAVAEGICCGDFALDNLQLGDQVKLLHPIAAVASKPGGRAAIWVRVAKINKHSNPEYQLLTGVIEEVLDLGDTGLEKGQTIRFARSNIVQIA
jgi:hypothetical protein